MRFGSSRIGVQKLSSDGVTPHRFNLIGGFRYGNATRYGYVLLNPQVTGNAVVKIFAEGTSSFGVGVTGENAVRIFSSGYALLPIDSRGSTDAIVFSEGSAVFGLALDGSSSSVVFAEGVGGFGIPATGETNVRIFAGGSSIIYAYANYKSVAGSFENDFVRGRHLNGQVNVRFVTQNTNGRF